MALTPEQQKELNELTIEQIKLKKEANELNAEEEAYLDRILSKRREAVERSREALTTAQKTVSVLNQKAAEEENSYVRKLREKELGDARLSAFERELALYRNMVQSGQELTEETKKRLKELEDVEKSQQKFNQAQEKSRGLINSIGDNLEDKILVKMMALGDPDLNLGALAFDKMNKAADNLAAQGLQKLKSGVIDMIFTFDEQTKAFERQFQLGEEYTQSIQEQFTELNNFGVSIEEATEAQRQLATSFTDFTMLAKDQRDSLTEVSAVLGELGVEQADFAKGVQNSTKFFGQSVDQAQMTQRELVATARELGVAPGQLSAQFAAAGGQLAKFGQDGVKAFKDLSRISKLTGMEMEKVLSVTNRFDTFEGAAEATGQLNAALGGNFVNAMDMMMETDPAARFESIRGAISDAGLSFDTMSYYQKQFYTEALGLSDVGDLALMLSGNMDMLGGATNATAEELIKEKERALEVQSAKEQLAIAGQQVMETFLPLVNVIQSVSEFLAKNTYLVKAAVIVYGAWKAAATVAKAIEMARTLGILTQNKALAVNTVETGLNAAGSEADALAKGTQKGVTDQLSVSQQNQTRVQRQQTAATRSSVGPMLAFGAAILMIGGGVFLAAQGIAEMARAFQDMDIASIVLLAGVLVGMSIGMYALAGAAVALGAAGTAGAVGLLAFGATVLMIGVGIGIAAAGVGLMAEGIVKIFEAIDMEKAQAFGVFLLSIAAAAFVVQFAGMGMFILAAGLGAVGFALKFIATKDLEAIAQFATGLAELEVSQIAALAGAIKKVAKAMDDVPTYKAITMTATMQAATTAVKAAQLLAGNKVATNRTVGAAAGASSQPINVNVTLELDGEVLARHTEKVIKKEHEPGGILSSIGGLLGMG